VYIPRAVHIPKALLLGLGLLSGLLVGWLLAMAADGVATASAAPGVGTVPLTNAGHAMAGGTPIYLTVVPSPGTSGGQVAHAPGVSSTQSWAPSRGPTRSRAPAAGGRAAASSWTATSSGIRAPEQVVGLSVVANGDHIVIANDGSIVLVGDNGVLRGNTGDASSSGAIAVDVQGSQMDTGSSQVTAPSSSQVPPGSMTPGSGVPPATAPPPPGDPASRATAIAGYQIRAIDVAGSDNLVTYDDSNLFFHRIGRFNGNTGNTDTSGLNVVDAVGSIVRSGDSAGVAEPPDPPPFVLPRPYASGGSASVADCRSVATATGDDTLVIGGDGVKDNTVRVQGDHNVVTYDDGNAAVGGIGDVNAQIGDSGTAGVVVMSVRGSHIQAGDSLVDAPPNSPGSTCGTPSTGDGSDGPPPTT
jgi:hypothetical protein